MSFEQADFLESKHLRLTTLATLMWTHQSWEGHDTGTRKHTRKHYVLNNIHRYVHLDNALVAAAAAWSDASS